jgi:hypothetical protein
MLGVTGSWRRSLVVAAGLAWVLVSVLFASGVSGFADGSDRGVAEASARNFEEALRMRLTKVEGTKMSARGNATGTIDGKVSLRLNTINGSKAKATFFGRDEHGTLSGAGSATYTVSGAVSTYSGKITRLSGTGRYSKATSRGISLSGTINRRSYDVKMTLSGKWDA